MKTTHGIPESQYHIRATSEALVIRTWKQFNARYPTEKDCVEELYRRITKQQVKCRYCGSLNIERAYGARTMRCRCCKKKTWFTAGTFFNRIRSARPWLAAIWLLEHGTSINSSKFQKLVGIAYASALTIFKKLTLVIEAHMKENAVTVASKHFAPLFCKRSRETPKREHPVSEQEVIDTNFEENSEASSANSLDCTATSSVKLKETGTLTARSELGQSESSVFDILSNEPINFDSLCERTGKRAGELSSALTMLELAGLVKCMPGDQYVRLMSAQSGEVQMSTRGDSVSEPTAKAINATLDYIRQYYHGISRKYLQNYLAAYWCKVDRTQWSLSSLLERCIEFRTIIYEEILSYNSPPVVKLFPNYPSSKNKEPPPSHTQP